MQDISPLRAEHYKESSNIVIGKVEIDSDGIGDFQTIPDVTNFYINTNIEDEVSRFCAYSFSVTFLNMDDKYFSWNTPSAFHNWLKQGRRIKIYGGIRVQDTFIKLDDPADLPPETAYEVAFSHDNTYLAVAHYDSPYITIYKRSGDTFTKLANPADLPAGTASGVTFSHDSTYLAVGHGNSPYITIYKRSGDTFTKLANPADLPAGYVDGVSFSHDSTYLAVAHYGSPYVTIYKRSGDTFTKLSNPADLPTGIGNSIAFSHNSIYLAVAHASSPYIIIYKRDGDTFTKLTNPANLPANTANGIAFSHDSTYLAVGHNDSPYITIYKRSGDTFTKLSDPAILPAADNWEKIAFSHDSTYLAVAHDRSPYITIYKLSGDTFTKLIDSSDLPTGDAYGVAFSHDSTYLAVAQNFSPFIIIYKVDSSYANYYHQWLTGRIDDWSLTTIAGQKTCTITGRDYMRVLLDYKLYSPNTYWGDSQTFDTSSGVADYDSTGADWLTCKGVYAAYADSISPYDGDHLTEIYRDLDWGYIETTNKFSFLAGSVPDYSGTSNLVVYYHQSQDVENVVGDILYYAGIFSSTGAVDTWLADTDYVTPTGEAIDRVWFNSGTKAMEAIRLLSEVVQYRFYFDYAGNVIFKPKISVGTYVDTFTDSDITQQEAKEEIGEVYNHIIVLGEKRETLG